MTGPVSDGHRASAALALFARALNKANGQPSPGNGKAAAELSQPLLLPLWPTRSSRRWACRPGRGPPEHLTI